MKNIFKKNLLLLGIAIYGLFALPASAQVPVVQTFPATGIQNNSAILNGNLTNLGNNGNVSVYFQWGTSTAYGNQTPSNLQTFTGLFNWTLSGLSINTTHHFRAVAQNANGTVFGQDFIFTTGQSGGAGSITVSAGPDLFLTQGQTTTLQGSGFDSNGQSVNYFWTCSGGTLSNFNIAQPIYTAPFSSFQTTYTCTLRVTNNFGNSNSDSATIFVNSNTGNIGQLSVTKQAINLTSGNLNWSNTVNANQGDILSFAIILQASGQNITNVIVRDDLHPNLINIGNVTVNTSSSHGNDIRSGINVGTIFAGQSIVVAYQARVAPGGNLTYGINTINNNAIVTSSNAGTQTARATVLINRSLVFGASQVPTGLTNNFWLDSFLLPLLVVIAGLWLYFSGRMHKFIRWVKAKGY